MSGAYYVGGLAGWNSGTIKDSTAKGYVSGKFQVGALVGANESGELSNSTGTGQVSETGVSFERCNTNIILTVLYQHGC